MRRAHLEWLYRELPDLVARGVVPPETAEALRRHYGPVDDTRGTQVLVRGLLVALGTILVGGGCVLIAAHNWDAMSRAARAALVLAWLLSGQALALFALQRRAGSTVWREASASWLIAAVLGAVALVSQTYQIPGDMGSYLRTCLVLAIPVVYVLDSAAAGVLVWGLLLWASSALPHWFFGSRFDLLSWRFVAWWGLAAAAAPYPVLLARRRPQDWRTTALAFVAAPSAVIGGAIAAASVRLWGMPTLYAIGAAALLHGLCASDDAERAGWRRLRGPAFLALVAIALVLTYDDAWRWRDFEPDAPGGWTTLAIVLAVGVAATWQAIRRGRAGDLHAATVESAWAVGALAHALAFVATPLSGALVFDLWLAAVGVTGLVSGWTTGRIGRANAGLLALAALALVRFWDTDLGFLVRGVAFVVVGLAFLAANLVLVRRMRAAAPAGEVS